MLLQGVVNLQYIHTLKAPAFLLSQPMGVYVMMQKYLQAQSLVWVFVVVGILQNIINVLVASLFIYVGDIVIV